MQLKKDTYLQGEKYRVISTLGQGGFGITYLAEQPLANRKVCIKEFFPKEFYNRDANSQYVTLGSQGSAKMMSAYKAKFIKEAQTIANLNHPNIIRIFDIFEDNGTAYYAMEYIEGESLNEKVKREGALAEDVAVKYIRDVASTLHYIHERKIMHLDVKPANIMIRKEDDCAILIDFGLSKQYDNAGDQTSSTPVGISHGYAPVEQYQEGGVSTFSPVTDIYSLGATLYYLVVGKVPAHATSIGEDGIGEMPNHLSTSVRNAITNAMSYWRKDRPKSIDIFLAMLDQTSLDKEIEGVEEVEEADTIIIEPEAHETPKTNDKREKKSKHPAKRKSRWWIWTLILVIGVIGVTAFFALRDEGGRNPIDTETTIIEITPPNNEIWYTSSDGNVVTPYLSNVFGATIVSNTYNNGKGVIEFDGDITTIGNYAFLNCDSLTSVTIPDGVTTIGDQAFYNCESLTNVTIPDSVTTIGTYAFHNCDSLTSVTIPDSVTTIGYGVFHECNSLTEFKGKLASEDGRCLIIDDALISYAIGRDDNTYTIPNNITTIKWATFDDCNSLTSVTIPNSVSTIESWAFSNCLNLKYVYCKAVIPPTSGYYVFNGFTVVDDKYNNFQLDCTIYVPRESVDAYKSATYWKDYADQIVGYDF